MHALARFDAFYRFYRAMSIGNRYVQVEDPEYVMRPKIGTILVVTGGRGRRTRLIRVPSIGR